MSEEKVKSLRTGYEVRAPGVPDAETIEVLEDMLQQARDGEIQGVAVAAVTVSGMTYCRWAHSYQAAGAPIGGAIARLQFKYQHNWDGK